MVQGTVVPCSCSKQAGITDSENPLRNLMFIGRPSQTVAMRKYLFVDGASFEETIKQMTRSTLLGEDVIDLVDFRLMAGNYERLFYYDSFPAQKQNQTETEYEASIARKQRIFNKINASPRCHVRRAFSKYSSRFRRQEQKGVDVLMAIDVLQHTYQSNMDWAAIITSDLDFLPLFDAILQTRVTSELIYEKGVSTTELIESADLSRPLRFYDLGQWLQDPHRVRFVANKHIEGEPKEEYDIIEEFALPSGTLTYAKVRGAEEYIAISRGEYGTNCNYGGGIDILCEQLGVPLTPIISMPNTG